MKTLFETVGGRTGISRLVHAFYLRAKLEPKLQAVFKHAAQSNPDTWWEQHLEKMIDFWSTITGGPSSYRGAPGQAHQGLGLDSTHFDAWMNLWQTVTLDVFGSEVGQHFVILAARMRVNLERVTVQGFVPVQLEMNQ